MDAYVPRSYQKECIEKVREAFRQYHSVLCVLPVGTGKTVIFSTLARDVPQGRVMILAHREELIFQAAERYKGIAGESPDIEMADYVADSTGEFGGSKVVVASVQSMCRSRRLNRWDPNDFAMLIVDEGHHIVAPTYLRVINHFRTNPNLKLLGVTATADRGDKKALGRVFQTVAYNYEMRRAIDDGWLTPIDQLFIPIDGLDLSGIKTVAGDFSPNELDAVMAEERCAQGVADATVRLTSDRPTLIFSAGVNSSQKVCEIINRHKPNKAIHLNGATPKNVRREMLRRFADGEFQYLCNADLYTEGFDMPQLVYVVMDAPTKSRSRYCQRVGRVLRPYPPGLVDDAMIWDADERREAIARSPKPRAVVLDFVGVSGRHKLVSTIDLLGGDYDAATRERAKKRAMDKSERGVGTDVTEEMKQIAEEARLQNEKLEKARQDKRKRLVAKAKFSIQEVSPWDVFDITPQVKTFAQSRRPPTPRMAQALENAGISTVKMNIDQASAILTEMRRRREEGLCTFKQARWLSWRGIDAAKWTKARASLAIDLLINNVCTKVPALYPDNWEIITYPDKVVARAVHPSLAKGFHDYSMDFAKVEDCKRWIESACVGDSYSGQSDF